MVHLVESPVLLLAFFLATFYLTQCLCYEDGAGDMFKKIRKRAGMITRYLIDLDGEEVDIGLDELDLDDIVLNEYMVAGDRFWSKVLECHRCTAPYVALLLLPFVFLFPVVIYVLGAGGATIYLSE